MPNHYVPAVSLETLREKIIVNIEPCPTTGCWLWLGPIHGNGYARMNSPKRSNLAHRHAYEAWVGPIDGDKTIDHTCGVRSCVNPMHLDQCTIAENIGRKRARNIFCKARLHVMSGQNIMHMRDGKQKCRACSYTRHLRWRISNPEKVRAANKRKAKGHGHQ